MNLKLLSVYLTIVSFIYEHSITKLSATCQLTSSIEFRGYNCEPQSSLLYQEPIKIIVMYN
jgi:hypothetical protein